MAYMQIVIYQHLAGVKCCFMSSKNKLAESPVTCVVCFSSFQLALGRSQA